MSLQTLKPMDFAQKPSFGNFQDIPYNWDRQSRVTENNTIYCGNKQTFDFKGQPNDSTNSSGSTMQTFDFKGVPNDSKRD